MSAAARSGLRFHDLGPPVVELDGVPLAIRGPRLSPALALLLIHANQRVSTDALIEAIWGEEATEGAISTLDSHLWRLRRLLEPDRVRGEPFTTVIHDAGGYRLVTTSERVDSQHLVQLLSDARDLLVADQPERALIRCEEALGMWRGLPWSPHSDAPWAVASVNHLVEVRSQLNETRLQALLDSGQSEQGLAIVEPLLEAEPLNERLWEMAMLAAYRNGRPNQALETYGRARRVMIEEIGIEPGAALRELQSRILARDSALDAPEGGRQQRRVTVQSGEVRLPRRRTDLLGRNAVLPELVESVTTTGLVTIVGAAGCGKTRLSIEVAREAAPMFPDGVWFVDLTTAHDDQQLVDVITSTLGLAAPEVGGVLEAIRVFTHSRRILLVLDNCEHILDAAADFVDDVLEPGSELAILATSREPLGLELEQLHRLTPLELPISGDDPRRSAAVQLFLDRLGHAAPHLEIGPAELSLAAQICTSIDGLPLAIELAAGLLRSFTLAEIAERVQRDPAGLAHVGRAPSKHHATLRGAIELSVDTLDPAELAVHRAVAVVPGPFTSVLAAHVTGLTQSETDQALAGLVHRSLLNPLGPQRSGGRSRFVQLATIRAHGLGRLADHAADTEQLRDQWVYRLITGVERLGDSLGQSWRQAVDDDLAAVRATLQHCLVERPHPVGPAITVGLTFYWHYSSMFVEWEHWAGLAATSASSPVERLLCSCSRASAAALAGRVDLHRAGLDELEATTESLTFAQQIALGELLLLACLTTWVAGGTHASQRAVAQLSVLHQHTGDSYLASLANAGDLLIKARGGDANHVLAAVEEGYRRAEAAQQPFVQWMIAIAGTVAALTGREPGPGLSWSDHVMSYFADLGTEPNVPSLEIRGALLLSAGRPADAVRTLASSRAAASRSGSTWPTLPVTAEALARARQLLTRADSENAYRAGLLGLADDTESTHDDEDPFPRRSRLQSVAS